MTNHPTFCDYCNGGGQVDCSYCDGSGLYTRPANQEAGAALPIVERVAIALEKAMLAHGTNDNTYIAAEDAEALAKAALEASHHAELVEALASVPAPSQQETSDDFMSRFVMWELTALRPLLAKLEAGDTQP